MKMYKLGKKPARYDKRDLQFENYLRVTLPKHPTKFGHESLVGSWGMLGNDSVGDCTVAGADHETMLWNAEASVHATFMDANAISDYSAITGYNPADPNTDQGAEVRQVLSYRQHTGLIDANGNRHKIGAYVALEPGNLEHLYTALYLFGAVGIGIEFPDSAMDQFNRGRVWSVVHGASVEGGHYIPLVAKRTYLTCVTWAKLQTMTTGFYARYCDEAWAIISVEAFKSGKSPEGFNLTQLQADLAALRAA